MGDWDHMGKAVGFGLWFMVAIGIVAGTAVPLAIWKIIDLLRWLF